MCEFCHKHGEGKKWYLQMKNYSDELLAADLSRTQRVITRARTRRDWIAGFIRDVVIPATGPQAAAADLSAPVTPARHRANSLSDSAKTRFAQVVHYGQVLPLEDVEQVIDRVESITRLPCGCRYVTTGKTDKRYCFGLGVDHWKVLGQFPDAAASFEVLDKEGAKRVFRDFDREGLMHSIWTGITPYIIGICNCDHDCEAYRHYIANRGYPTFFRAEYVARVNWELCTGCKSCIKQCQFGAMFYSSGLSRVTIDARRCFGCGVCRAACPKEAITLIAREDSPVARDTWLRD